MQTLTTHAEDRISERMAEAGIDPNRVRQAAAYIATKCQVDTAVLLVTLPDTVNPKLVDGAWNDRSNGNQVWAIIRGQRVRTVMLRRDTQPSTPQAFRVRRVVTDLAEFV